MSPRQMARLIVWVPLDTLLLAERLRRAGFSHSWAYVRRLAACALAERQGIPVTWPSVESRSYLRLM